MRTRWAELMVAVFISLYDTTMASCYFPQEYQGEFTMQSSTFNARNSIQYSKLNITATSIPIWGNCHRRIGNNFILVINIGDNNCIRCLHIKLRSRNVLQVLSSSEDTISKCYINEEIAEANCPKGEFPSTGAHSDTAEITLFKTKDMDGAPVAKEYCPIDGRYSFTYRLIDGPHRKQCIGFESTVDSCPSGSTINLRFKKCSFEQNELKFDCLGHWEGNKGQQYLALTDNRHTKDYKLQYRCAMYEKDRTTGVIHLALSADSTCITGLHNATSGYETFVFQPNREQNWPPEVSYSQCSFPDWMLGDWGHVQYQDNTLIYKDHTSFKTYTIKCVGMIDSEDKYPVFSRTQCDEEQYNCMRIQKRSNNVFEFQLGINFSSNNDVYDLCADANFDDGVWITQGRIEPTQEVACPISGEFTGLIPDTTDLCAKLWSDCRAPELMYYQVSDCVSSEVYEEREYRCLGHWREADLLYTYTQRNDVAAGTYECFVGSIVSHKEDIYIKEAGEHCQRRVDPLRYGMKLLKLGLYSCVEPHVSSATPAVPSVVLPPAQRPLSPYVPSTYGGSSTPRRNVTGTNDHPVTVTLSPTQHGAGGRRPGQLPGVGVTGRPDLEQATTDNGRNSAGKMPTKPWNVNVPYSTIRDNDSNSITDDSTKNAPSYLLVLLSTYFYLNNWLV